VKNLGIKVKSCSDYSAKNPKNQTGKELLIIDANPEKMS
jgi:hypothetical protein